MGILRELFGPSREEIWRRLCDEIGADYVKGGFWKGDKVHAYHEQWVMTLDTYAHSDGETSTTYTRMRAPYVNADGFRFSIYRKSIFSGLGKLFGMQDIEIGDAWFDEEFIIQGNDAGKVARFLANPRLTQLIRAQPSINLSVRDDEGWFGTTFPEGVDELRFEVLGVIKDVERLKAIYELFAEALNQLCHMGSAYKDDPKLVL